MNSGTYRHDAFNSHVKKLFHSRDISPCGLYVYIAFSLFCSENKSYLFQFLLLTVGKLTIKQLYKICALCINHLKYMKQKFLFLGVIRAM